MLVWLLGAMVDASYGHARILFHHFTCGWCNGVYISNGLKEISFSDWISEA